MTLRVETHIAGSTVVVSRSPQHYIDARKDVRNPHLQMIEVVRNGRVYRRETVGLCDAPTTIINLMRREFR